MYDFRIYLGEKAVLLCMCVLCGNGLIVIPSHWLPLIRCRQKKPRTTRNDPHLFHPIGLGLHLDLGLGLCLCWSWSWMDCLQNTKKYKYRCWQKKPRTSRSGPHLYQPDYHGLGLCLRLGPGLGLGLELIFYRLIAQ